MSDSITNIANLSDKVLKGVQKAISKLIEANAAKGEDMVIGNEDGSFIVVPATDLLSEGLPPRD
jgi:hypothetical protein